MLSSFSSAQKFYYVNDLDALNPEIWANESLAILEENMVLGSLVHRDFSPLIANHGDVVNTRKPGAFKAKRKGVNDNVTIQDAISVNIPVPLNQLWHTSFLLRDGEESKAFKDLVTEYLHPGILSIAQAVDRVLAGQAIRFRENAVGGFNQLTSTNAADFMLYARQKLNDNKIQDLGRNLVLTSSSETQLLRNTNFTNANFVGDDGSALRRASLGEKYGFSVFMAQNQPYVPVGNTVITGLINNAAGYNAGVKTFTVDNLSAAITAGTWITIGGDMTPLQVVSTVGGATPTSITVLYGIKTAVVDNAVITLYSPGAINNAAGYSAGYDGEIAVDGFTVAPQLGQPISFGTDNANVYTVIDTTGLVGVTLDRPLVVGVADNDKANLGPAGSYNFAFQKNAIAMVSRPLAMPKPGMGALSSVVNYNGISMRVVMTYNGEKQGTLVTFDILMGVAVLEPAAGVLLAG